MRRRGRPAAFDALLLLSLEAEEADAISCIRTLVCACLCAPLVLRRCVCVSPPRACVCVCCWELDSIKL
jgi:hypothetical protein